MTIDDDVVDQVLQEIFLGLGVKAHESLPLASLQTVWRFTGLRAGDLRPAIERGIRKLHFARTADPDGIALTASGYLSLSFLRVVRYMVGDTEQVVLPTIATTSRRLRVAEGDAGAAYDEGAGGDAEFAGATWPHERHAAGEEAARAQKTSCS